MAEALLPKQITVVVAGDRVSSCATYLFLAGATKIVLKNWWVVWHGGPGVSKDYYKPGMTVAEARKVDATVDRSFEFYERVGVDAALMHHTPGHGIEQLRIPLYLSLPACSYPPEVLEIDLASKESLTNGPTPT